MSICGLRSPAEYKTITSSKLLNSVIITILFVRKWGKNPQQNNSQKIEVKCPFLILQKYMDRSNSNEVLFTFW